MYKVTYSVKNSDGYLVDKTKKFVTMQEACKFIRELNRSTTANLIGRPMVERG